MPRARSLIQPGDRYGRLAVIMEAAAYVDAWGKAYRCMVVACDCGATKVVRLDNLRSGNTASCGCLIGDVQRARYALTRLPRPQPLANSRVA